MDLLGGVRVRQCSIALLQQCKWGVVVAWAGVMVGKMERRGGSGCTLVTVQA